MKADLFQQTVRMALDAGASGVSLFSADGMDKRKWAALRKLAAT
jgi:tagatose-1,6-bisphosphate aldolase